jgi:survival-of-motor-neuron-related-splicing factor 30
VRHGNLELPPILTYVNHLSLSLSKMEAELQTYLDQIAYVNLQLESDPTNDELVKLKTELNEIVNLTKEAIAQSSGSHGNGAVKNKGKAKETNPNWQDTGAYKAGMDCMAKYRDGKWYVYPDPEPVSSTSLNC